MVQFNFEVKGWWWSHGELKSKKVPVIIISSFLTATMTQVSNQHGENMTKPLAIDTYNHTMNGVDRNNQHCIYYSFVRRTLKWWKKMFFYLLECATVNSYLLYKNVTCKKLTSLAIRWAVIEALVVQQIQERGSCQSIGRPRMNPTPLRLNKKLHLLEYRSTYRNCVVCSGATRRTTSTYCKTCPDHPTLHPTPCFECYHTMQNYLMEFWT